MSLNRETPLSKLSVLWLSLSMVACGATPAPSSSGAVESVAYAKIKMKSTAIFGAMLRSDLGNSRAHISPLSSSACNVAIDSSTIVAGNCVNPIKMTATATTLHLASQYGGVPAQIQGSGRTGIQGLFGFNTFDFKSASTLGGTNNLTESKVYFDRVAVNVSALDIQYVAGVAAKFYNVRYLFFTQPPMDDTTLSACVSAAGNRSLFNSLGSLFFTDTAKTAPIPITRGDILVCVKDTGSATCAASDYQWIDASGALHSTRPTAPLQLKGTFITPASSCDAMDSAFTSFVTGGATFYAAITSPFTLTAASVTTLTAPTLDAGTQKVIGSKTAQATQYTFTTGCTVAAGGTSGVCTGTPTLGSDLTLTLDFDLANLVFFPTSAANPDTDSQTVILSKFDKILPIPIYIENNKPVAGSDYTPGVNVTVSAILK